MYHALLIFVVEAQKNLEDRNKHGMLDLHLNVNGFLLSRA